MTKTLPISQVRQKLPTLVDKAQRAWDQYIITVKGKPAAVLMSIDELESLQETMEILVEPGALAEIKAAEKEVERGEFVTLEELKKELKLNV